MNEKKVPTAISATNTDSEHNAKTLTIQSYRFYYKR